ncbi:MAG TPA: phosphoribosyltransferase [Acidimicrobiales bacterium]|nr:phosphoribosyltransferase [Acidimicrobiales bacterium]
MTEALGSHPAWAPAVVPVALCRPGDTLHSALRRYKDAPAVAARAHYAGLLGRRLDAFVRAHGRCVAAHGPWDTLAVVPSSSRVGRHGRYGAWPVEALVARAGSLRGQALLSMERGPGSACHLAPAPDAFVASGDVAGRRVLVVEDTWVTGARAMSAVTALRTAGAEVMAVLVLGRCVDPSASARHAHWWSAHDMGDERRCCLEPHAPGAPVER